MLKSIDFSRRMTDVEYRLETKAVKQELSRLQHQMKEQKLPVMVIFEGWDAAGKGSMISNLIQTLDPRFFKVYTTVAPTEEERRYPWLWRHWKRTPAQGQMAIFDESWYPEVSTCAMEQKLGQGEIEARYESINTFERQLTQGGTLIIKFFLHISQKEQARRLAHLNADKATKWRVTDSDKRRNRHYDKYYENYDRMLERTNTPFAPWHVVSAHERRSAMNEIFSIVVRSIREALDTPAVFHPESAVVRPFSLVERPALHEISLDRRIDDKLYEEVLKREQARLTKLHNILYHERIPVIVAYEGWDAAGKGGNIKRLTAALDPRGYEVVPIASPTALEKSHHYLWRFWEHLPKQGHITIFDRTWYGRVMVERIEGFCSEDDWKRAYQEINEFEYELERWGAVLLKFWIQIDKDEQLRRFTERQNTPDKQWKITDEDWRNREKWDCYETAVDEMIAKTSTQYAPWTIVESQDKKFARIKAIQTLNDAIERRL